MVLVRVGEDDGVDSAVPRRQPLVERDEEAIGVGPTVDEKTAPTAALDEDPITLADVENGDARGAIRSMDQHDRRSHERGRKREDCGTFDPRARALRPGLPG